MPKYVIIIANVKRRQSKGIAKHSVTFYLDDAIREVIDRPFLPQIAWHVLSHALQFLPVVVKILSHYLVGVRAVQ